MDDRDWIALWLLDRLVRYELPISRILDDVRIEGSSHWAFPGRAAHRSDLMTRREVLAKCVTSGLVAVVDRDWLHESRFGGSFATGNNPAVIPSDAPSGACIAVLTREGHEKWEREFQPDWNRFWSYVDSDYDEDRNERTISVAYASDTIRDELWRWFPSLQGWKDMVELDCQSEFNYKATSWKVLFCVKIVKWRGVGFYADGDRAEVTSALRDCEIARRTLNRFSKKWACVDPTDHLKDAKPELL